MIQIDMPMPEKCEDCIFCGDSCSCVASEYDGKGINVGCAFRTGRRDIRCPLTEQEAVEPIKPLDKDDDYTFMCSNCKGELFCGDILRDNFCSTCGKPVKWE